MISSWDIKGLNEMGWKKVDTDFYLVTPRGDFEEVNIASYQDLDPTQAYLIVVDQEQIMYIWRGVEISNRLKSILSRAVALLRASTGKTYRGQWVDQGQEPLNFQELFQEVSEEDRSISDLINGLFREEKSVKKAVVEEKRKTSLELSERHMACWPLPGKLENYIPNLTKLLVRIRENEPTLDDLASWASNWLGSAIGWTKSAIRITVVYTSLASIKNSSLHLTRAGQEFLDTRDNIIVLNGFLQGIWGIREILIWLKARPLTTKEIFAKCNSLGVSWETTKQIGHRLQWLKALGTINSKSRKYYLTDNGVEVFKKLGLELPPPITSVSQKIKPVDQSKDKEDGMSEVLYPSGLINWSHPKSAKVYQELLQEYIDLLRRKLDGESVAIISRLQKLAKDRLVRLGVPEVNISYGVIQGLTHKKGRFAKDGIFGIRYWQNHGGLEAFERYLKSGEPPSDLDEEFEIITRREPEEESVEEESKRIVESPYELKARELLDDLQLLSGGEIIGVKEISRATGFSVEEIHRMLRKLMKQQKLEEIGYYDIFKREFRRVDIVSKQKLVCPRCEKEWSRKVTFCGKCGTKLV